MESLLTNLPFPSAIAAIVVIILGVAAGTYLLDGYRSRKSKETREAADDLIGILQKTVNTLEEKVEKQGAEISKLTVEIHEVRKENMTLQAVLQGRDEQTKEFYRQSFEAMKLSKETHALVIEVMAAVKSSNENITKLIDLMGKHVDVIDHGIAQRRRTDKEQ